MISKAGTISPFVAGKSFWQTTARGTDAKLDGYLVLLGAETHRLFGPMVFAAPIV